MKAMLRLITQGGEIVAEPDYPEHRGLPVDVEFDGRTFRFEKGHDVPTYRESLAMGGDQFKKLAQLEDGALIGAAGNVLNIDAETTRKIADAVAAGDPLPEGVHPDEVKPRAKTWLHERANALAEIEQLRNHIRKLERRG